MMFALFKIMELLNLKISKKTLFLIINISLVYSTLSLAMQTIDIVDGSGKIRCPSGLELHIPAGTTLELTEHKVGEKLIVRVPRELSTVCSLGLLKYENTKNMANKKNSKSSVSKQNKKISSKEKRKNNKLKSFATVAEKMNYAERCEKEFVSKNGLGEWGSFIKEELTSAQFKNLLSNNKVFKNVCPRYRYMNKDEKSNLWVFILMSMSHFESSCRPQVEAQGPNGIAKGLLQLHEGAEHRYVHWDHERICKQGDSKNPKESLQCTLSMLNGQVGKFNTIFFDKSYWDVLRNVQEPGTHASKIKSAIQMLPDCGIRSLASDDIREIKKPKKSI